METFSALLAICAGNSPVPGELPAQRPVTRIFDVFFDLRLNKWLSKQSWGCDLRRHRAHYDVTVMSSLNITRSGGKTPCRLVYMGVRVLSMNHIHVFTNTIDLIHRSYKAPVPYPTMHH